MIKKLNNRIEGTGDVKGFIFTKEFENDKGYVFKVDTGSSKHYEVFYKKTAPICLDFQNRIYSENEKKEIYPKAKDFGVWAWCVAKLEKGIERLK